MEVAEFEEKMYESPLYDELTRVKGKLTPGQVLENSLGFDAALLVNNDKFWDSIGYKTHLRGAVLRDFKISRLGINDKKVLPTKRYNLFIQAKRSDYLTGPHKIAKNKGIKQDYYRFKISSHQQLILEKLAVLLGKSRALVTYAAPCFHTYTELYKYIDKEEIIENSNFVEVSKLKGHGQWIYEYPGFEGVACSEPQKIKDDELKNFILNNKNHNGYEDTYTNLKSIYKTICILVNESKILYFQQELNKIKEKIDKNFLDKKSSEYKSIIKYYLCTKLFLELNGIEWLVV